MNQQLAPKRGLDLFFWVFLALMPFVQAPALIDSTLVPRQLFLGSFIIFTTAVAWYKIKSSQTVSFSFLEAAFLGFFVFQLVALFFATNTSEAWGTVSRYAGYLGYFMLASYSLRNKMLSVAGVSKGFLVLSAVAVLFTGIQIFKALGEGSFWENIYVIKASFGHKNILSAVLMLGIPFQVLLYREKERIWSNVALLFLFLSLIEIFMLRTRGVWIATLAGGSLAIAVYYLFVKPRIKARLSPKLLLLAVGVIVLVGGGFLANSRAADQVADLSNLDRRTIFWNNSLKMIEANPIMGVGPGNWKIFFPKYGLEKLDATVQEGVTNIQRPHNDYLWVLSEGGILSAICFLTFFGLSLALCLRLARKGNQPEAITATVLLGGIVAYMIFSLADFPLERISPVVMVLTLIAIAQSFGKLPDLAKTNSRVVLGGSLLLGVVCLFIGYYRWDGERNAQKVLQANANRNGPGMIRYAADAENAYFNMDNYANPLLYFSGLGYQVARDLNTAQIELEGALEDHPYHMLSLYSMGNNYKYKGDLDKADMYYQKALDIAPINPRTRVSMAEVFLQQKKWVQARNLLNEVKVNTPDPRFKKMIAQISAYFYSNYQKEQVWGGFVDFMRKRNPKTEDDFFNAYVTYKKQHAASVRNTKKAQ